MKQKSSKKLSWQYLFFARRIQTGPRHYAAKLVLIHLGDAANNQGQSWHGYSAIGKLCNNMTASAVRSALLFLRDELGILTWKSGTGGFNKKDTNTYTLNLEAMKAVVANQGVFDAETGKILYDDSEVDSSQNSGLPAQSTIPRIVSVDSSQASVDSSQTPVDSSGTLSRLFPEECNPHGTPNINPHIQPGSPSPFFSEVSVMPHVPEVVRATAEPATPVANPLRGRHEIRSSGMATRYQA